MEYGRSIRVIYDAETQVHEVTFTDCVVNTEQEALKFCDALAKRLQAVPPPRDLLLCLDGLEIAPEARPAFGRERARVARAYYRYSARYAGQSALRVTIMTSSAKHQVDGMTFDTRQEALAHIFEQRAKDS